MREIVINIKHLCNAYISIALIFLKKVMLTMKRQLEALLQIKSLQFDEDFEDERESGKAIIEIKRYIRRINKDVLVKYKKLMERYGRTALVPIRNDACQGCYLTVPSYGRKRVLKEEEIYICEHCGRMIYNFDEDDY